MVDKKLTKLARTASNVVGEDLWGPKSGLARLDTPERASASRTRDCSLDIRLQDRSTSNDSSRHDG